MIVPLSAIHLAIVVLGLVFQTSEWAVFLQIVAWLAIDPTCAIEGIAFDTFGDSETQARQATSTVLSVFTIAFACSCTFGGILYDLGSWTGVAMYHLILQGLMLVLLALEPACRHSFMRVFFADADEEMDLDPENAETKGKKSKGSKDPFEIGDQMFIAVIPDATEIKLPSAVDELQIEEVTGTEDGKREKSQMDTPSESTACASPVEDPVPGARATNMRSSMQSGVGELGIENSTRSEEREQSGMRQRTSSQNEAREAHEVRDRRTRGSQFTVNTLGTRNTNRTHGTMGTRGTLGTRNPRAAARLNRLRQLRVTQGSTGSKDSGDTNVTRMTKGTAFTRNTGVTKGTKRTTQTGRSALSQMTKLSQAGQHFRHHFASQALLPEIVGATGRDGVMREEIDVLSNGEVIEVPTASKGANIPKDVRLPAFFIVLNSFCNTCAYILEYTTFAIFFKQVHNWNNATFAGMTQMSGDVIGALAMQLIPALFGNGDMIDPDELGYFRRKMYFLVSKPYTLSLTLFTWILFNLGMMSPSLPLAITAQVLMGTTFVYSCKWSTDMNLFYSLGDSQVFLSLQVLCRNADAIGGSVAGVLATWLFSLDPAAPFALGTALASVIFMIYTAGFCARLGFGDDIEDAEQKRSRRLGLRRVSSWKSVVSKKSMKSTVDG